jgi:hypothetical protein
MKIKLGTVKVQSFVTSLRPDEAKAALGAGAGATIVPIYADPATSLGDSGGASNDSPDHCSANANCTYITGCSLPSCWTYCHDYFCNG